MQIPTFINKMSLQPLNQKGSTQWLGYFLGSCSAFQLFLLRSSSKNFNFVTSCCEPKGTHHNRGYFHVCTYVFACIQHFQLHFQLRYLSWCCQIYVMPAAEVWQPPLLYIGTCFHWLTFMGLSHEGNLWNIASRFDLRIRENLDQRYWSSSKGTQKRTLKKYFIHVEKFNILCFINLLFDQK